MMKVFLVLVAVVAVSLALPDGAPEEACGDMIPQHGADPSPGGSDLYDLHLHDNGDGSAEVHLQSMTGTPFIGFFLQAHDEDDVDDLVGSWSIDPAVGKPRPCPADGPNNGVTHVDASNSYTEITAIYEGDLDHVHFHATVVESFDVFYVDIEAHPHDPHMKQ